jgi:hypothetical protein
MRLVPAWKATYDVRLCSNDRFELQETSSADPHTGGQLAVTSWQP